MGEVGGGGDAGGKNTFAVCLFPILYKRRAATFVTKLRLFKECA